MVGGCEGLGGPTDGQGQGRHSTGRSSEGQADRGDAYVSTDVTEAKISVAS